jgi:hypothetical protein
MEQVSRPLVSRLLSDLHLTTACCRQPTHPHHQSLNPAYDVLYLVFLLVTVHDSCNGSLFSVPTRTAMVALRPARAPLGRVQLKLANGSERLRIQSARDEAMQMSNSHRIKHMLTHAPESKVIPTSRSFGALRSDTTVVNLIPFFRKALHHVPADALSCPLRTAFTQHTVTQSLLQIQTDQRHENIYK